MREAAEHHPALLPERDQATRPQRTPAESSQITTRMAARRGNGTARFRRGRAGIPCLPGLAHRASHGGGATPEPRADRDRGRHQRAFGRSPRQAAAALGVRAMRASSWFWLKARWTCAAPSTRDRAGSYGGCSRRTSRGWRARRPPCTWQARRRPRRESRADARPRPARAADRGRSEPAAAFSRSAGAGSRGRQRIGPCVHVDAIRPTRQLLNVTGSSARHAGYGSRTGTTRSTTSGERTEFSQVRRQGLEPRTRGLRVRCSAS